MATKIKTIGIAFYTTLVYNSLSITLRVVQKIADKRMSIIFAYLPVNLATFTMLVV